MRSDQRSSESLGAQVPGRQVYQINLGDVHPGLPRSEPAHHLRLPRRVHEGQTRGSRAVPGSGRVRQRWVLCAERMLVGGVVGGRVMSRVMHGGSSSACHAVLLFLKKCTVTFPEEDRETQTAVDGSACVVRTRTGRRRRQLVLFRA